MTYHNLTEIQKTIHAIRQCLKIRNFRQLDAELATVEAKQQIEAVGNDLKTCEVPAICWNDTEYRCVTLSDKGAERRHGVTPYYPLSP
jgi:hypothetical protein